MSSLRGPTLKKIKNSNPTRKKKMIILFSLLGFELGLPDLKMLNLPMSKAAFPIIVYFLGETKVNFCLSLISQGLEME